MDPHRPTSVLFPFNPIAYLVTLWLTHSNLFNEDCSVLNCLLFSMILIIKVTAHYRLLSLQDKVHDFMKLESSYVKFLGFRTMLEMVPKIMTKEEVHENITNSCCWCEMQFALTNYEAGALRWQLQELKLQGIKIRNVVVFSRFSRAKFFANDLSIFWSSAQAAV